MFGFFLIQLQDRRVIPVSPIMFRSWRDRFQDKTLKSYDYFREDQHLTRLKDNIIKIICGR